ncbi:MAG: hypothetical protein LBC61_02795 [Candidatus Peribacteria bacterium]|nr:hypothetical protein [Candidatus Peribacteria bacterium]
MLSTFKPFHHQLLDNLPKKNHITAITITKTIIIPKSKLGFNQFSLSLVIKKL